MKVLGISGTLIGKKTTRLVQQVLNEIKEKDTQVEIDLLDLADYNMEFCDGRPVNQYNADTQRAIRKILEADCFVIGTPIFQASLTGALKNVFDLIPPETFRGKVMGFVATGGTYQHFLVVENQLKPIAGYFKAYIVPEFIYAHRDHFDRENELVDEEIKQRISVFGNQLLAMSTGLLPAKQKIESPYLIRR